MKLTRDLRMLTRYSTWANERLFDLLESLHPAELTAPRQTGLGSMLATLGHNHVIDLIWKSHLEGRRHGFTSRVPQVVLPLDALRTAQAEVDGWYVGYADALTEQAHAEIVHFDFVDGGTGTLSRGDMLLHVINHKTYHRGYVADMLYQAGFKPPVMDIPVFMRDAPPVL